MKPLILAAAAAAMSLAGGCAQPFEGRVATSLAEAGLSRGMADCMASRWVDRLNIGQLAKIQSLAEDLRREGQTLTVGRFVERVRAMDDPEVVQVVTLSAAACALS